MELRSDIELAYNMTSSDVTHSGFMPLVATTNHILLHMQVYPLTLACGSRRWTIQDYVQDPHPYFLQIKCQ